MVVREETVQDLETGTEQALGGLQRALLSARSSGVLGPGGVGVFGPLGLTV